MAVAVAERVVGVDKECASCGGVFTDPTKNQARSYCTTCRPIESKGMRRLGPVATAPMSKLRGRPFTVAHFRRWSARFKLKSGERFEVEQYQALVLKDVFARHADGRPVYSEIWLVIPEGNGKTTFVALLVLYFIEFKAEAWVPVAASSRDQGVDLTYRICGGLVERNKFDIDCGGPFRLHPGYRQIVHTGSRGSAKIFASDAGSGDGVDPDLAVIEELHRLKSMDLYETWAGKLLKSRGQLVICSTAGEPGSPFEELRERIRQSAIEMRRVGGYLRAAGAGVVLHEYALPEGGDPHDLRAVKAANPFSGITVEALADKHAKPSWRLGHWMRFTCNVPTRSEWAAITEQEWAAARVRDEIPEGEPIWAGLDLAFKWDTTALVPLWWRDDEYRLLGEARILEPPRDGNSLDSHLIERAILELHERNPIHTIVVDKSKAEQLCQWISDELGAVVVERAQTNAFAVADYEVWMEALERGWLRHTGDVGLAKHVLNASAKLLPGGDTRFDRPNPSRSAAAQSRRVIDALTAASQAHSEAVLSARSVPAMAWGAI